MSSPTKDSLLYLIYGQGPYNDEAAYSILSALHLMGRERSNYRIVVYTDDPEAFGDLPVHTELLSASVLDEWSGPLAFNHRRKIAAVKDALERFGGRVLLCDTDTCFVKHPKRAFARVRPGHAVMHVAEYYLSDRAARPMAESLAGHIFLDRAGSRWNIGGATVMFNSGVIGLHQSDISVLDEVMSLTDQVYAHARFLLAEQLAFSVCLQHYSRLHQSYDVLHHYWPPAQRALFRGHLSRILHEQTFPSREEQFRALLPLAPRIAVQPLQWGTQSVARRLNGRMRVLLSRAAHPASLTGLLRRVLAMIMAWIHQV
jgi:hypothetical protein